MLRFSLTVFTATALLAAAAPLAAQTPGRIELRALAGAALPLGPSDFSDRWNVGPSGALSVGYVVAPHTTIAAEFAYASYPEDPLVLPVVSGTSRTSSPPTSSWAAWLDGSRVFSPVMFGLGSTAASVSSPSVPPAQGWASGLVPGWMCLSHRAWRWSSTRPSRTRSSRRAPARTRWHGRIPICRFERA